MPITKFPNGVSSFGVPVFGNSTMDGKVWGTAYFVDAAIGTAGAAGTDPEHPLSTIQAALDKCTTSKGDRVFVRNGAYAEDLTMSKDDVMLIGQSVEDVVITGATDATDT